MPIFQKFLTKIFNIVWDGLEQNWDVFMLLQPAADKIVSKGTCFLCAALVLWALYTPGSIPALVRTVFIHLEIALVDTGSQ